MNLPTLCAGLFSKVQKISHFLLSVIEKEIYQKRALASESIDNHTIHKSLININLKDFITMNNVEYSCLQQRDNATSTTKTSL